MTSILNILNNVAAIISLIGTFCLILSYSKQNEIKHTLKKGKVTEGTVIKLTEEYANQNLITLNKRKAPLVEFHTVNGHYQYQSITYRYPTPYEVGQKVKIYYYFYKSIYNMALADDEPGTLPKTLLKWGLVLCIIGYPIILSRLTGFF